MTKTKAIQIHRKLLVDFNKTRSQVALMCHRSDFSIECPRDEQASFRMLVTSIGDSIVYIFFCCVQPNEQKTTKMSQKAKKSFEISKKIKNNAPSKNPNIHNQQSYIKRGFWIGLECMKVKNSDWYRLCHGMMTKSLQNCSKTTNGVTLCQLRLTRSDCVLKRQSSWGRNRFHPSHEPHLPLVLKNKSLISQTNHWSSKHNFRAQITVIVFWAIKARWTAKPTRLRW